MVQRRASTERLGSFSDGVFTVVITIMVLELKPPEHPTFAALLPLWPTALSYVVSYYFIAIVWLNHHHRGHQIGSGSRVRLCSGFRTRQPGVHPIRVARIGFGFSGGDFGPDATVRKSAFVSDIGNLHCCDAGVAKVSLAGLWIDLLRFAGLSAARTSRGW